MPLIYFRYTIPNVTNIQLNFFTISIPCVKGYVVVRVEVSILLKFLPSSANGYSLIAIQTYRSIRS